MDIIREEAAVKPTTKRYSMDSGQACDERLPLLGTAKKKPDAKMFVAWGEIHSC